LEAEGERFRGKEGSPWNEQMGALRFIYAEPGMVPATGKGGREAQAGTEQY
jgi:hypothetical protein